MSRSYKKTAGFTDNSSSHENKKIASRIVRRRIKRGVDIPDGNSYRKYYASYDICDFRFMAYTKAQERDMAKYYEGKEYRLRMK